MDQNDLLVPGGHVKHYDLSVLQPEIPATLRAHYEGLARHAGECIGCRRYGERCPFGVPISPRTESAAKLFGL